MVVAVDFAKRVELWADVSAVIANCTVQVDSKFVVGAGGHIAKINLCHGGFLSELSKSNGTCFSVAGGAHHVAHSVLVLLDGRSGRVGDEWR